MVERLSDVALPCEEVVNTIYISTKTQ